MTGRREGSTCIANPHVPIPHPQTSHSQLAITCEVLLVAYILGLDRSQARKLDSHRATRHTNRMYTAPATSPAASQRPFRAKSGLFAMAASAHGRAGPSGLQGSDLGGNLAPCILKSDMPSYL